MTAASSTRWVQCIALFKLLKAIILIVALGTGLHLLHHDPTATVLRWALKLHVDPDNHYLHTFLAWLLGVDVKHLKLFAVGTGLYALLFAVEGIGLWLVRTWAEYLTIVSTAGFLPLEGYELHKHISLTKMAVLGLNIAIVGFLIRRVRQNQRALQVR